MEALLTVIAITVLGAAAAFWGTDSRDGRDWEPRPEHWAFPRHTS